MADQHHHHQQKEETDDGDDADVSVPLTYTEWLRAVEAHPHAHNVLVGPWEAIQVQLKAHRLAVSRIYGEVEQAAQAPSSTSASHPPPPPQTKWSQKQINELASAHPEWFELCMEDLLGEPCLAHRVSYTELLDRAELYAERAAHCSWNAGHERTRYFQFTWSHQAAERARRYIDAFKQFIYLAVYRAITPQDEMDIERDAAMVMRGLHHLQMPLDPKVSQWLTINLNLNLSLGCLGVVDDTACLRQATTFLHAPVVDAMCNVLKTAIQQLNTCIAGKLHGAAPTPLGEEEQQRYLTRLYARLDALSPPPPPLQPLEA